MTGISTLQFLRPDTLWSLAVILPLVAVLTWVSYRERRKARQEWGEEKLIERFSKPFNPIIEGAKALGWLVSVALVVIAASGPVLEDAPVKVPEGSMSLISVVDVSNSMAAEDYRAAMPDKVLPDGTKVPPMQVVGPYGSRLDMTKYVIQTQVMPTLERIKIGLVNYTGQGFIQADLTDDYTALTWVMDHWMRINQAPGGGSDYAEGLKTALEMFKGEPKSDKQKVILLFTDGGFTGDDEALTKVIDDIRAEGIRIIVVGIGSASPVTIPLYSSQGQVTGYLEKDGQVVTTGINEAALQGLVSLTGGEYIRLDPNNPKVHIEWAKALGGTKTEKHKDQVFQYPLAAAAVIIGLILLAGLFKARRSR